MRHKHFPGDDRQRCGEKIVVGLGLDHHAYVLEDVAAAEDYEAPSPEDMLRRRAAGAGATSAGSGAAEAGAGGAARDAGAGAGDDVDLAALLLPGDLDALARARLEWAMDGDAGSVYPLERDVGHAAGEGADKTAVAPRGVRAPGAGEQDYAAAVAAIRRSAESRRAGGLA